MANSSKIMTIIECLQPVYTQNYMASLEFPKLTDTNLCSGETSADLVGATSTVAK